MARTKQTARMSYVARDYIPRAQLFSSGIYRHSKRPKIQSESEEEKPNTNQFSLKFDNQVQCQQKAIKAEPFSCTKCQAFINKKSVIETSKKEASNSNPIRSTRSQRMTDQTLQEIKDMSSSVWKCQFCSSTNILPSNVQIPSEENPCYFLQTIGEKSVNLNSNDSKVIIYCIDISGSMDTMVETKTRLQAVQEAIKDQVKRMKFVGQSNKIGIVVFGSKVQVKCNPVTQIPEGSYYSFEQILAQSAKVKNYCLPVSKSHKQLTKIVQDLSTYGSTALGPGLLASIQLASRLRGSKIILCTDGEANVGVNGPEFYTKSALLAKEKGVMISILSLKGDRCNLKQLSKLALQTGGAVMKIDPKLLGSQFNKISQEKILGTESSLKIVVGHVFEIQDEATEYISANKTILNKQFGNFTDQTELTFNFKILSRQQGHSKNIDIELFGKPTAPMQIQLNYINTKGQRYLQVVNDYRQLSSNVDDIYKEMNFGLYSANTLQNASKKLQDGNIEQAQKIIDKYTKMVEEIFSKRQKKTQIQKFRVKIDELQTVIKSRQSKLNNSTNRISANVTSSVRRGRGRGKGGRRVNQSSSAALPGSSRPIKKQKRKRGKAAKSSESQSESGQNMESDEEQQILMKCRRARSRSRSPS